MKVLLASAAVLSALAFTAPAASAQAYWQSINQRQANLDHRIDQGVRSGALTRGEAARLRAEFHDIAALEVRYRRSGGGLNSAEIADLDRRFDRLSAQIRYERNDRDDRGRYDRWQNINARQANLDHRIDVGVRNGSLTRTEARRLRIEFQQIAALEQHYRRTGGGLNAAERRDLDDRFDRLSARIRYERADWQDRRRY